VVLRRRYDGHQLSTAFGGLADFLQHHARRFFRQLAPVGLKLSVRKEVVVVTDVDTQLLHGRGDLGRCVHWGRENHGHGDKHQQPPEFYRSTHPFYSSLFFGYRQNCVFEIGGGPGGPGLIKIWGHM